MTLFTYIGQHFDRIKKEIKIGIIPYSVIKHWVIYSRYDYYRKAGYCVSDAVLFASQENNVSENWVYNIIKKMEGNI